MKMDAFGVAIQIANDLSMDGWIQMSEINRVAETILPSIEANLEKAYDEGEEDGRDGAYDEIASNSDPDY